MPTAPSLFSTASAGGENPSMTAPPLQSRMGVAQSAPVQPAKHSHPMSVQRPLKEHSFGQRFNLSSYDTEGKLEGVMLVLGVMEDVVDIDGEVDGVSDLEDVGVSVFDQDIVGVGVMLGVTEGVGVRDTERVAVAVVEGVRVRVGVTEMLDVLEMVGVGDGRCVFETEVDDVQELESDGLLEPDTDIEMEIDGVAVIEGLTVMDLVADSDTDGVPVRVRECEPVGVMELLKDLLGDWETVGVTDGVLDMDSGRDMVGVLLPVRLGVHVWVTVRVEDGEEPLDGVMLIEGVGTIGNENGERDAVGDGSLPKHSRMKSL